MSSRPNWISEFVNQVCRSIQLLDEDAPIGCHYALAEMNYEISLFASATEIVGGPNDGERVTARFFVDVVELMQLFDIVDSITWQPQIIDESDEVGAHLSMSGVVDGNPVWLRILSETPEQFLPGRIAQVAEKRFINIWDEE